MRVSKIKEFFGNIFIALAFVFIFIFSLVMVGDPNEPFARDLFGLKVPNAPLWTSYIPYLGWVLSLVFEFFSLHGIIGLLIFSVLFHIGIELKKK